MEQQVLSKNQPKAIYYVWAKHYDFSLRLFNLIGFRYQQYRKEAVNRLNLKAGNTVVDLGCGTGLNFPLLEKQIGPEETTIIGVDLSESMLQQAQQRVSKAGWKKRTTGSVRYGQFFYSRVYGRCAFYRGFDDITKV